MTKFKIDFLLILFVCIFLAQTTSVRAEEEMDGFLGLLGQIGQDYMTREQETEDLALSLNDPRFYRAKNAQEDSSVSVILATSKFAGGCGIMSGMSDFQQRTKLQGGDEFIKRFVYAESARLGITVEEWVLSCQKAIAYYDDLWLMSDNTAK